jgi:hypothetical protein
MPEKDKQPLQSIIGKQLTAVTFVMDYIKLQFEHPVLTTITLPSLCVQGAKFTPETLGYRDALCERITEVVCGVSVVEGQEIRLEFTQGAVISISLKSEDAQGPEFAMFEVPPQELWVWRQE